MNPPLKLGFDNYALRSLDWKAPRLLEHAAALALDSVLFSDLTVLEHHSGDYLADLRAQASSLGLEIQVGTLSICPSSALWNNQHGSPADLLKKTIEIARALGSPVARCVLGNVQDRRSPGGIQARIAETVEILKSVRPIAVESGIQIALENHAGDLQARELVDLLDRAGPDFVGATIDSGNAPWALEHPQNNLEILGPRAVCSGIRDSALWNSPDGAVLQWTAMGDGQVDFLAYFERFAELCPQTTVQIETISGRPNPIPFRLPGFWNAYPGALARDSVGFFDLVHSGTPRVPVVFPDTESGRSSEQQFQLSELERSVRYCRETLGLGVRGRST
jgi:3-oxoisoapionate decarboxylase